MSDELRAAADKFDALADAATPGPWTHTECVGQDQATRRALGTYSLLHNSKEEIALLRGFDGERVPNAAYIAAMHPAVAKALATWLRDVAKDADRRLDSVNEFLKGGGVQIPAVKINDHAIAVARAINGGAQ